MIASPSASSSSSGHRPERPVARRRRGSSPPHGRRAPPRRRRARGARRPAGGARRLPIASRHGVPRFARYGRAISCSMASASGVKSPSPSSTSSEPSSRPTKACARAFRIRSICRRDCVVLALTRNAVDARLGNHPCEERHRRALHETALLGEPHVQRLAPEQPH